VFKGDIVVNLIEQLKQFDGRETTNQQFERLVDRLSQLIEAANLSVDDILDAID